MKLLQIVLLLGAGLLAGTLVTKVWLRPQLPAKRTPVAFTVKNVPAVTNVYRTEAASSVGLPIAAESSRPSPVIPATTQHPRQPQHHLQLSPAKTAARKSPARRRQPTDRAAPVVLAKVTSQPALGSSAIRVPQMNASLPPTISKPPQPTGSVQPTVSAAPVLKPQPSTSALADSAPAQAAVTQQSEPSPSRSRPGLGSARSAHQVILYPGLLIPVRLLDALSSETNRTGDRGRDESF